MKIDHIVLLLLALVIGILAAIPVKLPPICWMFLCLGSLILLIHSAVFNRRTFIWLLLACFLSIGSLLTGLARDRHQQMLEHNKQFNRKEVTVEGVQIKRSENIRYGIIFTLEIKKPHLTSPNGKIVILSPKKIPSSWFGRRIRVTGKFKTIPEENLLFPQFEEKRGLTGTIVLTSTAELLEGPGLPLPYIWADRLRSAMIRTGNKVLSPENAAVLHGMIFSDKLGIKITNPAMINDLRRTGTIHLLSVSGLHIGFLVIGLSFILNLLKVKKVGRVIILTSVIWFYILMTGLTPPVLRAGVMFLIVIIGQVLKVGDNHLNRLSLAAVVLLLFNPYQLFELGFQLSFTATFGILWLFPLLEEHFPVRHKFLKLIWQGLLVSISAQLMIIPVIVYYFEQISWISPLVNLLIIIPVEIIVTGGLIGESLGIILPLLGKCLLIIVDWNITYIRWIVYTFASPDWAISWCPPWPWPWIFAYYVFGVLILDHLRPSQLFQKRRINYGKVFVGILVILNLFIWSGLITKNLNKNLAVTFIDVGQGDAVYIRTPDQLHILIDGGDVGKGNRVLQFLWTRGVKQLDFVLLTHPDRDHSGGLAEVLQVIPVKILYLPPYSDSRDYDLFLHNIKLLKSIRKSPLDGKELRFGRYLKGKVLFDPDADSENDRSLVLALNYGKNSLLLTGDLSFEGEIFLTRKYPQILRSSVLKVGHHGSNYASGLPFLMQVKPKVAIISVGSGNRYGHPGDETINRLRSCGTAIYRTDRQGLIDLKLDGEKIYVRRSK